MRALWSLVPCVVLLIGSGCARKASTRDTVGEAVSSLSAEERRDRSAMIRDVAEGRGITNGLLLAGIGEAETGLAHCWSEATWACRGPVSADCDGPVIAGSGDGPCEREQGGLGMFQFDAGTYEDTIRREGERVLSVAGNVDAAVDFVLTMVQGSVYIDGVETEEQAIAWLNEVRPWNDQYAPWIQTVTHYYNGCRPGACRVYDERLARYGDRAIALMNELGADFWYGRPPACGPIPQGGAVLEETDGCFGAGGNPRYWRTEEAGSGGSLLWTNATDAEAPANWAFYGLSFEVAGPYHVEVYTDAMFARSRQTAYAITHSESTERIVLDQWAQDGFQSLGVFEFASGGDQRITVGDNTGEPGDDPKAIVVDAVRLTRVPTVDEWAVAATAWKYDPLLLPPRDEGGCSVAPSGRDPMSASFALALFAAFVMLRRARRR